MVRTDTPPPDVMAMLERLAAIEALRELKARYAELADSKFTADYQRQPSHILAEVAQRQAECFTPDAIWEGGSDFGRSLRGREALRDWFSRPPWCFALHFYVGPRFKIDAGTAEAQWRLWQLAVRNDTRETVLLAATTQERYVREPDGSWLHAAIRFEQIHIVPLRAGPDALLKRS
jgi:hypothetical protein